MMYLAIAFTLLALVAGTHLLIKVKTNDMGSFARIIAYAVIIVSIGMLLCELGRTGMRMMHRGGDGEMKGHHMGMMQYCPPELCGGVPCMIPMGASGMDCCKMGMKGGKGAMDCCKEGMGHAEDNARGKCCEEGEGMMGHGNANENDSQSTENK